MKKLSAKRIMASFLLVATLFSAMPQPKAHGAVVGAAMFAIGTDRNSSLGSFFGIGLPGIVIGGLGVVLGAIGLIADVKGLKIAGLILDADTSTNAFQKMLDRELPFLYPEDRDWAVQNLEARMETDQVKWLNQDLHGKRLFEVGLTSAQIKDLVEFGAYNRREALRLKAVLGL